MSDTQIIHNQDQAGILESRYVCSRCYGQLIATVQANHNEFIVRCVNQDCDGKGFVTRTYAERRQRDSEMEQMDASINLRQAMPALFPKRDPDDILKELGY